MIIKRVIAQPAFGILSFDWTSDLTEFRRFNLIYGWNRSGKTTLARVFTALANESVEFRQYPEKGHFEVITDTGSQVRQDNLAGSGLAVRVFSQDFVDDNVLFDSSTCKAIVYISAKDIANKQRLDKLRALTDGLVSSHNTTRTEIETAEKAVAGFLEATALNIKNTVGNLREEDLYRTYDKRKLKGLLDGGGVGKGDELTEEEFENHKALIATDAKSRYKDLPTCMTQIEASTHKIDDLSVLDSIIRRGLSRQVGAETIGRLKEDPALNTWVKTGLDWQSERNALGGCPYCERALERGFIERLRRHFSDEYLKLESVVQDCLSALDGIALERIATEVDLYSEFTKTYEGQIQEINGLVEELGTWIDDCRGKLNEKARGLLSVVALPCDLPRRFQRRYNAHIRRVNAILAKHNTKVANHHDDVRSTKEKLAKYIAAGATRGQKYERMTQRVQEAKRKEEDAAGELRSHREEITLLEKRTSDIGSAVDAINGHLADLFGGTEIQLSLASDGQGYVINRGNREADNLCEGEKTAIAFAYFLAKVRESSFDLREGVVVIDDPISSLDSNFTYHCFALVQRQLADAGQLIILTHNFAFFNLVKAWFNGKNRKCKHRNHPECCSFYAIETRTVDRCRRGCLTPMDPTLRNFNSEYQYLFAKLRHFADVDTPDFDDLYSIGNIARRFLEIYAGFKIPTTADLRGKVEQLPTASITDAQKDRMYRLVQEFSHAEDPSCGVEHRDRSEAQEATRILLRIVEESDPAHFAMLSTMALN